MKSFAVTRPRRLAVVAVACVATVGLSMVPGSASAAAAAISITSLSISRGSTVGGTNTVINGYGFSAVDETASSAVTFGGTDATRFIVLSNTQIAVKAPAGTGVVDVRVTASGTTSAITTGDKFTYRVPITTTVTAGNILLNPLGNSAFGVSSDYNWGTSSTFLSERITATVGGVSASITYVDATHATVKAPAGTPSATAVPIVLIHDSVAGTADSTHAKFAAVVGTLNVTSGVLAGGGALTVTGKGLTGATSWMFGTVAATCTAAAAPNADTRATCTIPASAASGTTAGAVTVSFTPAASVTFAPTAGSSFTYTALY